MCAPTLMASQPPLFEAVEPSSRRITPTMRGDCGTSYSGTSCGVKRSHALVPNTSGSASSPTTRVCCCASTDALRSEMAATTDRYFIFKNYRPIAWRRERRREGSRVALLRDQQEVRLRLDPPACPDALHHERHFDGTVEPDQHFHVVAPNAFDHAARWHFTELARTDLDQRHFTNQETELIGGLGLRRSAREY